MLDIHYTVCSVTRLSTIFGFGCATRTAGLKGQFTSTTHQHSPVVNKNEKKSLFRKAGLLKLMSGESYQHLHQETILTLHSFNLSLCWRKATAWRSARQVPLAPLWIRQTSFARTNLQLHMSKHAGWVGLSSLCVTCCNRTQKKKKQLASFSTSRSGKA